MKLSFKIILGIWFVLLLILAGVVYTAYSKLRPEALISVMKQQVEKNYPGSKFEVGSMDYRLALDFKVELKQISLSRSGKKLVNIGEVEVKIPWWLFLTSNGTAQININNLDVMLDHNRVNKAFSRSSGNAADNKIVIKANIPQYLQEAKYTLRAKDIVFRDQKDMSKNVFITKLLVREFQLNKNSAFEMTIPIEVNHNQAKYNSELWLFGDITPKKDLWSLNYRGEFKTRDVSEKFQLEDVTIDGKASLNLKQFEVLSQMNFLIEKENVGSGTINIDGHLFSANIKFKKFPLTYLGIIYEEIKNPFLPELDGYAQGSLVLEKNQQSNQTVLNSKVSFDGTLPLGPSMVYAGKWNLNFDNAKWETSFMTPNGEVSFFRRSIIDFETGSLVQFNEEMGFSGIEFANAILPLKSLAELRADDSKKYFVSTASFKDCLIGETKINGEIKYGKSPDMSFYQSTLIQNESKMNFSYQQKALNEQLSLELKKFPWNDYKFLAPFFNTKAGVLDGKVQGRFTEKWTNGEWLVNLKGMNLSEPSGDLISLMQKAAQVYNLSITDNFEVNAEYRKNKLDVKGLNLDSSDPAKLTGTILPEGKGSVLTLTYPKNKKWKPVKKELEAFEI